MKAADWPKKFFSVSCSDSIQLCTFSRERAKGKMVARVAIVAHDVTTPLSKHRSLEFSKRVYALSQRFEVHVISRDRDREIFRAAERDAFAPSILVHHVHNDFVSSTLGILRITASYRIDLIFADITRHALCSLFAATLTRTPILTFVQGYDAELTAMQIKLKVGMKAKPGLLGSFIEAWYVLAFKHSARILCVSPGLVEHVVSRLPKSQRFKVMMIPFALKYVNEVDDKAEAWADRTVKSLGGGVSRIQIVIAIGSGRLKGTDIVLRSFSRLSRSLPDTRLVVVAKVIDRRYLALASELGVREKTLFLENLERGRVLALLRRSQVLLHPSYSEGESLAKLEAMALNVPVVMRMNASVEPASRCGAVLALSSDNPIEFAQCTAAVLDDKEIRRNLVSKAHIFVKERMEEEEEGRYRVIAAQIEGLLKQGRAVLEKGENKRETHDSDHTFRFAPS